MKILDWCNKPTTKLKFAKYILRLGEFIDDVGLPIMFLSIILAFCIFLFMFIHDPLTVGSYMGQLLRYELLLVITLYAGWEIRNFWDWINKKSESYVRRH